MDIRQILIPNSKDIEEYIKSTKFRPKDVHCYYLECLRKLDQYHELQNQKIQIIKEVSDLKQQLSQINSMAMVELQVDKKQYFEEQNMQNKRRNGNYRQKNTKKIEKRKRHKD